MSSALCQGGKSDVMIDSCVRHNDAHHCRAHCKDVQCGLRLFRPPGANLSASWVPGALIFQRRTSFMAIRRLFYLMALAALLAGCAGRTARALPSPVALTSSPAPTAPPSGNAALSTEAPAIAPPPTAVVASTATPTVVP